MRWAALLLLLLASGCPLEERCAGGAHPIGDVCRFGSDAGDSGMAESDGGTDAAIPDSGGPGDGGDQDGGDQDGGDGCGDMCAETEACTDRECRPRIDQVVASRLHTCARFADGRVACWGLNSLGQIGDGTMDNRAVPVLVDGISDAIDLDASDHTCVVHRTGQVSCWGNNGARQVAADRVTHSRPVVVPEVTGATDVSTGKFHTCTVLGTGQVSCWGSNNRGELSRGVTSSDELPGLMLREGDLEVMDAAEVAAGEESTCIRLRGGRIECAGVVPMATTFATTIPGLIDARSVSLGLAHLCVRRSSGAIACAGDNDRGQLGEPMSGPRASFADVGTDRDWIEIHAGWDFTCGIRAPGTVWCWGRADLGSLGDGGTTDRSDPGTIDELDVAQSMATGIHVCAVIRSTEVWCWGGNEFGALGNGTTESSAIPVRALIEMAL